MKIVAEEKGEQCKKVVSGIEEGQVEWFVDNQEDRFGSNRTVVHHINSHGELWKKWKEKILLSNKVVTSEIKKKHQIFQLRLIYYFFPWLRSSWKKKL